MKIQIYKSYDPVELVTAINDAVARFLNSLWDGDDRETVKRLLDLPVETCDVPDWEYDIHWVICSKWEPERVCIVGHALPDPNAQDVIDVSIGDHDSLAEICDEVVAHCFYEDLL